MLPRSICFAIALAGCLPAQPPDDTLFESKIRPVLATKCYACHSSKLKAPMGGLRLDTKAGLLQGGATGPVVVAGKPDASRLMTAIGYRDTHLQMPPGGKLPDAVIADFQTWIANGAKDPRQDTAPLAAAGPSRPTLEQGRKWWAFQPLKEYPKPGVQNSAWARTKIDSFILQKLESSKLAPSKQADRRTLIRRATLDLVGIAPSFDEVEAFVNDSRPDAYAQLIDKLLASPQYGERWGRYWLDVARYGEDNPRQGPTNPAYMYAWRYRDWVIEAVNKDIPYDRFIKLQLAADLIPQAPRDDWRALGFLGVGPVFHKDQRLSKEVIEGLASDDWDERVDLVSRGVMGMTVACARCHDHKFDPISSADYYGMAGIFASSPSVERPLFAMDKDDEAQFLGLQQQIFERNYLTKLLSNESGTDKEGSKRKVAQFKEEIAKLKAEQFSIVEKYPELNKHLAQANAADPFVNAVYDAAQWIDGEDATLTRIRYTPGSARDLPVFLHGNPGTPGDRAPRRLPAVLSKPSSPEAFQNGSGRLALADRIFADAAPLAARVIVNRVWGWHFGSPLVASPSDFGTQGDKPTHPELLDDLAARFIANSWSIKWLHREILLSAAYQQSSKPRADGEQTDPANQLLWRMNSRRMDIEAYRDSILRAAGALKTEMYGPSTDLDAPDNTRRTVYAKISREKMNTLLRMYDMPDASQHSPMRGFTTTPLQQLFVLNSDFIEKQSAALAASAQAVSTSVDDQAKDVFQRVLARAPNAEEMRLAKDYLKQATLAQYSHALLALDEFIFWP